MVVGQHVPRALGITDTGVEGVRQANPQIRRIHMAHVPILVRAEVATGAMMAGIEVEDTGMEEDMGMVEHIIGTIDPVAARCLAAYPSTNAMGKSLFVCGCTKWCTTLPLLIPAEEIGARICRALRAKAFRGCVALAALHLRGV